MVIGDVSISDVDDVATCFNQKSSDSDHIVLSDFSGTDCPAQQVANGKAGRPRRHRLTLQQGGW